MLGAGAGLEHWGDLYYGAVYLESIRDLLTPRLSEFEAHVITSLLGIGPADRVLDAGCGHGRHARVLAGLAGSVVGVDRSAGAVREASGSPLTPTLSPRARGSEAPDGAGGEGVRVRQGRGAIAGPTPTPSPSPTPSRAATGTANPSPFFLRGDVRALPFTGGAFDAAYSWYASLFMFDEATNLACLAGIARVVRPGGRVLVHHANPLRLALEPLDAARRTLPDGTVVDEESVFDPRSGVDRSTRRLVRPDGAVVAATAELRYYSPAEWRDLSRAAGLRIVEITTTPQAGNAPAGELGPDAPDLIALLEKPT